MPESETTMPKDSLNPVQRACKKALNILRRAQDVANNTEWRRLQSAISRVALSAGLIRPMAKRKKRNRTKKEPAKS